MLPTLHPLILPRQGRLNLTSLKSKIKFRWWRLRIASYPPFTHLILPGEIKPYPFKIKDKVSLMKKAKRRFFEMRLKFEVISSVGMKCDWNSDVFFVVLWCMCQLMALRWLFPSEGFGIGEEINTGISFWLILKKLFRCNGFCLRYSTHDFFSRFCYCGFYSEELFITEKLIRSALSETNLWEHICINNQPISLFKI